MRIISGVLIFAMSFSSSATLAQVKAHVEKDSLFSPMHIVVDGKKYGRHFFSGYSDLSDAMRSNPEAVEFANRARKQAITGSAFLWGGIAAALTYSVTRKSGDWRSETYWTIFAAGFIPGVFFMNASEMNTLKAVNAYNGVGSRYSQFHPLSWSF